jgi:RNA recognition motif-containing protein
MSFTVFLGNLPTWVTADDIKQWLAADDLVADSVKVIRNHETQESKGFAFVEAPTQDEMQAIIRRFDRAPLEDKLLRANPAQPSKGKPTTASQGTPGRDQRSNGRTGNGSGGSGKPKRRERDHEPKSAFATELANSLAK